MVSCIYDSLWSMTNIVLWDFLVKQHMVTSDKDLSYMIDGGNPFFNTIRYTYVVLKMYECFHLDFVNIVILFYFVLNMV